jgi:hypothetical protein
VKATRPPTRDEADAMAGSGYVGGRLPDDVPFAPVELDGGRWAVKVVSRGERQAMPDMVLEREGNEWKVVRQKKAERRDNGDPVAHAVFGGELFR